MSAEERPDRPGEAPARAQFSLQSMFALMTATAVACGLLFQVPDIVAVPIILFVTVAVVPVLVTVLVYGSGYQRTFAIGALSPCGLFLGPLFAGGFGTFLMLGMQGADGRESLWIRIVAGASWLSSIIIGLLCVAVRWELERDRARAKKGRPVEGEEAGHDHPSADEE